MILYKKVFVSVNAGTESVYKVYSACSEEDSNYSRSLAVNDITICSLSTANYCWTKI